MKLFFIVANKVFLFWKVFIGSLKSFFSFHKVSKHEQRTSIILDWDGKKYDLNFKEFKDGLDQAMVKDLKEKCKQVTEIPIASMKLRVSGANIKDDTATLTSVGVCPGSIIELNGEKVDEDVLKETSSGNPEEYALMVRISKTVGPLNTITDDLGSFEELVNSYKPNTKLDDGQKKAIQDRGIFLSEKIMQCLISLDSVECPSEFETARQRRREGVRSAQKLLEKVDSARAIGKQLCKN